MLPLLLSCKCKPLLLALMTIPIPKPCVVGVKVFDDTDLYPSGSHAGSEFSYMETFNGPDWLAFY